MSAILLRLGLLAGGIGIGQMGLDALAHGADAALVELGLALVLLFAGSAGFMAPLVTGGVAKEVSRHG